MLYDVRIQREEFREHVFRVEAGSANEAWHAGLGAAQAHDFSDDESSGGENVLEVNPVDDSVS